MPPKQKKNKWTSTLKLNPDEVHELLNNDEFAAITFYKDGCPHCDSWAQTCNEIAEDIHASNKNSRNPPSFPIVIAAANVDEMRESGDPMADEITSVPTIVFKNGQTAQEWEPKESRDYHTFMEDVARFTGDNSTKSIENPLNAYQNADYIDSRDENPEFLFFYDGKEKIIPRFTQADPVMVNVQRGNDDLSMLLASNPELLQRGQAINIDLLDRTDIRYPSIFDLSTNTAHDYRDAENWIRSQTA